MALTDTAIRNTKPAEKPLKLTDERGLYLLLKLNGSRWWRFDYRYDGKPKTLSMASIPTWNGSHGERIIRVSNVTYSPG